MERNSCALRPESSDPAMRVATGQPTTARQDYVEEANAPKVYKH